MEELRRKRDIIQSVSCTCCLSFSSCVKKKAGYHWEHTEMVQTALSPARQM